jgi:hypothetical protein
MAKNVSEAETAEAAKAIPADQADAAGKTSAEGAGPSKSDAPQLTGAAGTNSTDALIAAGKTASAEQLGTVSDFLKSEEDKFRAAFPHLVKAIDAWKAANAQPPRGVRIVSLVEGFRRAGIAHGREAADYPAEAFKLPEALEALFSEPKLVVTFI